MQTKNMEKYFFFALLLATLVFTFFIFRPFWVVLVLGISFSVVVFPIYRWFKKKLPNWVAALFSVILFAILVCGPLLGIGVIVFDQSQNLYESVAEGGSIDPYLESLDETLSKFLPSGVEVDIEEKASEFVSYTAEHIASIFTAALSAFFSFILMLLIMFYLLKDGTHWKEALIVLSPLGDKDDEKIITRLGQSVNAVIKGYLLIALVQGLLMGFGLFIFGVPNAALWGVVASVASLVPTVGTALVSVPAIIFLFATGETPEAVGLIVWATLIVGMVDNFLTPYIVGEKIKIPPLLILFAVLGGISFLGPAGVLVGPLSVSLLYSLIAIYRNEYKQNEQGLTA